MAIPVRLLAGVNSEIQVDLNVQSLDIGIERNVSAFPTPNNVLKRFATDTNIPRITIEMQGILDDDAGATGVEGGGVNRVLPMRKLVNFGSMLPTEPFSPFSPVKVSSKQFSGGMVNPTSERRTFDEYTTALSLAKGAGNTLAGLTSSDERLRAVDTRIYPQLEFTGSHSIGDTGAFTVESTHVVAGVAIPISLDEETLGARALLNIGDRIIKPDGTFLGLVSALTSTTITFEAALTSAISANDEVCVSPKCFNQRAEFIGYASSITQDSTTLKYDLALVDNVAVNVLAGDTITINQSENRVVDQLHGQYMKLVPAYWLEDPSRNPAGRLLDSDGHFHETQGEGHIGIRLQFNANKTPPALGGSDQPSVLSTAKGVSRASQSRIFFSLKDAYFFDAVIDVPIGGLADSANSNPAQVLAELVEDALTNPLVTGANISTVPLAPSNDKTLTDVFTVRRSGAAVIIESQYSPDTPVEHPEIMDVTLRANFAPEVLFSSSQFDSAARKSAGDKAQDLIGLVSNAERHSDLFRGVQIPYDSLITSSGVTGVARNFFLTFGNVPPSQKGSLANERSASAPMRDLVLDASAGGNKPDEGSRAQGLLDRILGDLPTEPVESFLGFLVDNVQDMWVTLSDRSTARHNDGGIRIIPEKVHVRYDAGQNYYEFHMVLVATDYVMGV